MNDSRMDEEPDQLPTDYDSLRSRWNAFWSLAVPCEKTDCWFWRGRCTGDGYPRWGMSYAHRMAWKLARGPIPDGLFVLHRCDNPSCVNPDHLFVGTQSDNMRDMVEKGRQRGGAPRKTHCKNGHALVDGNLYQYTLPSGRPIRNCRQCMLDRSRARYQKLKAPRIVCENGHDIAGENAWTVVSPAGKTIVRCKKCRTRSLRRHHAKKAAKAR